MSKILIIDDSSQMSDLLREMVSIFGHTAEVAHSGTEGIEKVKSFEPDLILLDIMMPGMDGWGFYEAHQSTSDVPVIMISADASFATRKKADDVGVMLLEKGVEPFLLRDIIAKTTASEPQSDSL
ncbi:MAG: response regulator [Chloroflexota bacterium]